MLSSELSLDFLFMLVVSGLEVYITFFFAELEESVPLLHQFTEVRRDPETRVLVFGCSGQYEFS